VKLPAAGVHPVQRWRGELGAEFGRLPGDQGAVAAAGAADVDEGPVRLAYHAVPGFGDAVTVGVQPDDGEVLALLHCLVPGGGLCPQVGQARRPAQQWGGSVARLTPLGHPTINLDGRYRTTSRPPGTGLRPLRTDLLRILYRSLSQALLVPGQWRNYNLKLVRYQARS
jgi:hypothetical protein